MTLALDSTHDLVLGSRNGIGIAKDGVAVAQGILTRLQLFKGEWYLDIEAGTPWFQKIFADGSDIRIIEAEIKRQILATPGVRSISTFFLDIDKPTRAVTITSEIQSDFGVLALEETL